MASKAMCVLTVQISCAGHWAALSAKQSVLQLSVTCISRHTFPNYAISVTLSQRYSISKMKLFCSISIIF